EPGKGVLIASVLDDSPAEKGGLKAGDIILEFDGTKVEHVRQLQRLVARTPVGKEATVKVLRDGKELLLRVKIGEMPAEEIAATDGAERYGFAVQDLTPEILERLRLSDVEGVLISWVEEGGPAAKAGLRSGDVITEVNREKVKSVKEFNQVLKKTKRGENLLLLVVREGMSRFIVVPPKQQ
ncbi:MAG: PDZ domain-containing protein, partial [Candidatus Methylomirabilales bacterium]